MIRDPAGPGWDEPPEPYVDHDPDFDGDRLYDEFIERVDRGDQCPDCKGYKEITREVALGIPIFHCACGASWFDWVTRPAVEAA